MAHFGWQSDNTKYSIDMNQYVLQSEHHYWYIGDLHSILIFGHLQLKHHNWTFIYKCKIHCDVKIWFKASILCLFWFVISKHGIHIFKIWSLSFHLYSFSLCGILILKRFQILISRLFQKRQRIIALTIRTYNTSSVDISSLCTNMYIYILSNLSH